VGVGGGKMRGMYLRPKDSNAAVGVHSCATEKALERADKQTDSPRIIVMFGLFFAYYLDEYEYTI